ncbi:hypothetical protein Pcinc_005508 [Petrolisthes cinctipes]|uniref:Uncharacterized protein n=1 Tax=Petrolisthes cinctipes TaxID=88211 RepID=A0AAE1GCI6_PETCI|nr:hypothetical protein Pcinc_005508 [Petrolisthes cinctipes]
MAECVTNPLHISQSDVTNFLSSKPTRAEVKKLQKSELLLVACELGLERESDNVFPLVIVICSYLFGTSEYEFADKLIDTETVSESVWNSRDDVNERTVLEGHGFVDNEQAKRDHELRMLQLQLSNREAEREAEREARLAEREAEREARLAEREREREAEREVRLAEARREEARKEIELAKISLERHKVDKGVHVPSAPSVVSRSVNPAKLVPVFEEN